MKRLPGLHSVDQKNFHFKLLIEVIRKLYRKINS
jgi:hypothetical protein